MSLYRISEGVINKNTVPTPKRRYGKSKLQADEQIIKMAELIAKA
jgi:hypothetical protein